MKAIWMLLLLTGPATAADLAPLSNSELCVRHVTALIANQQVFGNTEAEIAEELHRRSEACADTTFFIQIAEQRITDSDRAANAEAQALANQERDARIQAYEDRQDRNANIRNAGRAFLEMQQQQQQRERRVQPERPKITNCMETNGGVQCTTF